MKTKEEILRQSDLVIHPNQLEHILQAMEEYANQSKWIDVKDSTPPVDKDLFSKDVLILYKNGDVDVDKWDFYNGTFNCFASTQVTHWQYLPTSP